MNVSKMKQVSVKVVLNSHDGSIVECIETGLKISDSLVLSVYENGVEINEFQYDQAGDIVLGNEVLGLQGLINDSAINLEDIENMSAIEFLMKIATFVKDLH
ncbi:hypothetical protein P4T34_12510 [Bacillus mobilis]|uniref:hypothetical protein n=1 Tax=Bacillus mobilis TaxID=2026190 RepID=UPI002E215B43|nr:hypothetical protein [Bacillus mobilis]